MSGKRCIKRTDKGRRSGRKRHHTNGSRRAHKRQRQEQRQRQGQREGQRQKQRERQRKEQGQGEGRNIRHVESEVFLLQGKSRTRKDCPKFSALLAEKKTVGHEQSANSIEEDGWIFALDQEHEELCELIMIDSGASVHLCPPDHGQENGLRKSSKTRPLLTASGAEMTQHGVRQVNYDTEVGKITTDYRVLDVRRPIWSLGSMMDSGCAVHFTKNRCWKSKDDGKELDIRSGGVFFVAARP